MDASLINVSQCPANGLEPEERDFWGLQDLEAAELPLTQDDAIQSHQWPSLHSSAAKR